jgi:SAM-dependent methyltransferase
MRTRLYHLATRLKGDPYQDPWKRSQYRLLAGGVAGCLQSASTVVDLGCGDGLFTIELKDVLPTRVVITGVDLEPAESWDLAPPGISFRVGDVGQMKPGEVSADAVIAKDLLHHMDQPEKGVRAIAGAARKYAVIIEANLDNPIMDLYTKYNGDQHFGEDRFRKLVLAEGGGLDWRFVGIKAYPFYLPPVVSLQAVWVWPATLAMLVAFKVFQSGRAAHFLSLRLSRLAWPPPYTVAIGTVEPGGLIREADASTSSCVVSASG